MIVRLFQPRLQPYRLPHSPYPAMHPRAEELIRRLGLQPHPEGGFYREVFRSSRRVQPYDARPPRTALTLIYFLLVDGGRSRWHRVASDEAWSWVEGDPLELARMDLSLSTFTRQILGAPGRRPRRPRWRSGGWRWGWATAASRNSGCAG